MKTKIVLTFLLILTTMIISSETVTGKNTASGSISVRILFPSYSSDSSTTSITSISPPPPPYSFQTSSNIGVVEYLSKDDKILLRLSNNSDKEEHIALLYRIFDYKTGEMKREFMIDDIQIDPYSIIRIEMPDGNNNDLHLTSLMKESEIIQSLALRK